jgi:hypothetical protein
VLPAAAELALTTATTTVTTLAATTTAATTAVVITEATLTVAVAVIAEVRQLLLVALLRLCQGCVSSVSICAAT